jgi:hypothetical protein
VEIVEIGANKFPKKEYGHLFIPNIQPSVEISQPKIDFG